MAYVTDTTARDDADYIDKIRGVDLLIHECYFPDGWEDKAKLTGHSCISPVARVARAAGVGRMVLVHINPWLKVMTRSVSIPLAPFFPAPTSAPTGWKSIFEYMYSRVRGKRRENHRGEFYRGAHRR